MRVLRLPCKGSWLGAAETEGFRFFLEKPPLEAEKRPGYAENPVILLWRGLAAGQAGTPQSAALTAPLAGEPRSFRAGVLAPVSRDGNLSKKRIDKSFLL